MRRKENTRDTSVPMSTLYKVIKHLSIVSMICSTTQRQESYIAPQCELMQCDESVMLCKSPGIDDFEVGDFDWDND